MGSIFSCAHLPPVYFFGDVSLLRSLAHFLIGRSVFYCWFLTSLFVFLEDSSLSDVSFATVFCFVLFCFS